MYSTFLTWKGEFDKYNFNCALSEGVNPIVMVLHAVFVLNLNVKSKLHVITATHTSIMGSETMLNLINMFIQWSCTSGNMQIFKQAGCYNATSC